MELQHITHETKAFHLSIIDVPLWCKVYTEKAILASVQLLTVQEFIQTTEFELDIESFDILYASINYDDVPLYINSKILKWMAYEGDFSTMKKGYIKLLKSNFKVESDYKTLTNDEYEKYYDEKIEPDQLTGFYPKHKKGNKSHLLVYPNAFKASVMMLKTSKGSRIRDYYITLEKLIQSYFIYQCLFKKIDFKVELKNISILNHNKKYTQQQSIIELDKILYNIYKVGCVYYIQEEKTKNIKIGWCWNLLKRLKCLQVANSQTLNVIKYELSQFPYEKEQYLHKKYKDYHIRGEWYQNTILL